MEKKFTNREIAVIKRVAKNVNPMVTRKNKIEEQMKELQAEYELQSQLQEQFEAPIKTLTGGYTTEDLVEKVIETTSSFDKNGKPIRVTKYVLKYPDTIVPPEMEGADPADVDDTATVPEVEQNPSDEDAFNPMLGVEE